MTTPPAGTYTIRDESIRTRGRTTTFQLTVNSGSEQIRATYSIRESEGRGISASSSPTENDAFDVFARSLAAREGIALAATAGSSSTSTPQAPLR